MSRVAQLENVIGKFHAIHGNRYGYQFVEYRNAKTKVGIWCRECKKVFWQTSDKHMSGCGCPVCANRENSEAMRGIREKNAINIFDEFKKVHGDRYDYSLVQYTGADKKVEIICKTCGEGFFQKPIDHKRGAGCKKCAVRIVNGRTVEQKAKGIVQEFMQVHGDKYDYSRVEYCGAHNKVEIVCRTCKKIFMQTPDKHKQGYGCPSCAMERNREKTVNDHRRVIIQKFTDVHGSKYGYEFVEYIGSDKKVKIWCNGCGRFFWQTPANHLQGQGCYRCNVAERDRKEIKKEAEIVIAKFRHIHGDKYGYDRVVYAGDKIPVEIECRECDRIFRQSPGQHKAGHGCPYCKESKGERMVERILKEMGLRFEREKRFIGCRNINFLPFDFYVSTNSGEVVIECHGEQHYRPIAFWGGRPAFEKRVMRDGMKKRFCENRGIQYIEIPYGKPISLVRQMLSVVFPGNVKTVAA